MVIAFICYCYYTLLFFSAATLLSVHEGHPSS